MTDSVTPGDESVEEPAAEAVDEPVEGEVAAAVEDRVLPDDVLLSGLAESFEGATFTAFEPPTGPRQDVVSVDRADVVAFVTSARDSGFETFIDLCAVDHFTREPRFDVVVNLLSMQHAKRLRIVVGLTHEDPVIPSLTGVFAGANFYEREAWDLFGIRFTGHPDLTRLLLPDEWVGHPLLKDQGVGSVPIRFKGVHKAT
jgi:NADH-quinone oxidoreductase subunit C